MLNKLSGPSISINLRCDPTYLTKGIPGSEFLKIVIDIFGAISLGTGSGSMKMLTDLDTELGKPKLQIGIRNTTFGLLSLDFASYCKKVFFKFKS